MRASRFFPAALLIAILACPKTWAIETFFEKDSRVPLVTVQLAVRGGAISDPESQLGLTNFLGEMMLRGTLSKTKKQIDLELDRMGANLGVEARSEYIVFRGAVLRSELPSFLALLKEILTEPSFPQNEIDKLRSEIVSGLLAALSNDRSLVRKRFNRYFYGKHPYGRDVLGQESTLSKISAEDLRKHYDSSIRAKRMLVVASGDSSASEMESFARSIEGARPGGEIPPIPAPPPPPEKQRIAIIDKPERTQTQVLIGQPGVKLADPIYEPLSIGNFAFGGGAFSSRLMVEIRVKRGWTYGAGSGFSFGTEPRTWTVGFFPASQVTPPAVAYAVQMIRDLASSGITPEEFEFSQKSMLANSAFDLDTPGKRVENTLEEKILGLPDGYFAKRSGRLAQVDLKQVNTSLKRFLTPDRLTLVVVGTAKTLREPLAKALGVPPQSIEVIPFKEEI